MKIRPYFVIPAMTAGLVFAAGLFAPVITKHWQADAISAVANVLLLVTTLAGVLIAASAIETWRAQIRGEGRLQVAIEIASAIGNLKIEFQNQRAAYIENEFPEGFDSSERREGHSYRKALEYVYSNRLKALNSYMFAVHALRGKALTILGSECAEALVALVREARRIEGVWRLYCQIESWHPTNDDQKKTLENLRSMAIVPLTEEPTDELSVAFNLSFERTMAALSPFLEVVH